MKPIPESELILSNEGRIYHLNLLPEELAPIVITVGDPDRVGEVSKHFDIIHHKVQHREFITHTGELRGKRISVLSTGIGPDNIDICLNELDALVNIDFNTRLPKAEHTTLTIVRIGTSGSLQEDLNVDTFVASTHGIGLDNVMLFYETEQTANEMTMEDALSNYFESSSELIVLPYVYEADPELLQRIGEGMAQGMTATCPGFFGPQGRTIRTKLAEPKLVSLLSNFKFKKHRITNFEMETSAIYGLSRALGHKALSTNVLIAQREKQKFSADPKGGIEKLINLVLEKII